MKLLVKVLIITIFLNGCNAKEENKFSQKEIDELSYKGFLYGYKLPKSISAADKNLHSNITKCTKLDSVIEQTYCTLGISIRAMNKSKLTLEEVTNINIEKISEFSNARFHYIGHHGYGEYDKRKSHYKIPYNKD